MSGGHVCYNFLSIQFTVFSMVVNQRLIWDPRFGKKYPLASKIKTLSSDLKKKSKSGNPQIALAEFVKSLYPT